MLPAGRTQPFSLADVLPNCFAALRGESNPLGLSAVSCAIVLLADGLGEINLRARRGHARTLAARIDRDGPLDAGFPSTTVASLASLTTGTHPGDHGMVGYTALDPEGDRVVNVLSGWEESGLDPATWQRRPTLFESEPESAIVVGPQMYRNSGLTRAVLRGAEYRGADSLEDRVAVALAAAREQAPRLIYVYAPETDIAAHRGGANGAGYTDALEALDAAVRRLVEGIGASAGLLVTADHGIIDVPSDHHRIVPGELLAGVRHVAGEPRGLQLHLEAGVGTSTVAAAWRAWVDDEAWVATRDAAIAAGWFGEQVDAEVQRRIGDVLVVADAPVAYYLDAAAPSRGMVGQHGGLTDMERTIPLLRFGAFAG